MMDKGMVWRTEVLVLEILCPGYQGLFCLVVLARE
jgi:hypothetical protein